MGGQLGEGGRWHSHLIQHMPCWSTVKPVVASAHAPGWLWLCLATTTPGDHSEASLEGVWFSWAFSGSPHILVGHGTSLSAEGISLTPLMNRFHTALWWSGSWKDSVLLLRRQKGLLCVPCTHASVLLAGAPISELPGLLSSCNRESSVLSTVLGAGPSSGAPWRRLLLLVLKPPQLARPPPSLAPEPHTLSSVFDELEIVALH